MPFMSIAQIVEIPAMFSLALFLRRFGARTLLSWGAAAACFEFILFAWNPHPWCIPLAIAGHGLVFTWFSTVILMLIDEQLSPDERPGVHQLMGFLSPGLSSIIGGISAGFLFDLIPTYGHALYWSSAAMLVICGGFTAYRINRPNHKGSALNDERARD